MIKPTLFLRIASVLTFIHAVLHTIGGVFSKPDPGPGLNAYQAMQTNQFLVFGLVRSYADFYRGLGLCTTVFLTAEAIVFWQLGGLAKTNAQRLRPILATFLLAYLALSVNSWFYFFQPPVVTEVLIALCLAAAIFTARQPSTACSLF
jgi:hypothetical protein